jgi:hypothetical protein
MQQFSYSGCIGITFCASTLKITSLLLILTITQCTIWTKKGKLLGVIMLAEDGLRGVNCVAMDEFDWLWLGCKDGALHFANYQYFKTTTRKERRLLKQNIY